MTKEELEKEAEQYISNKQKPLTKYDLIAFAEPREKQIERLSKEIDDSENMKATLESRVAELEAQIEKMKCCENCRYCNEWGEANSNSPNCKKCNWVSNWKLRR